MLKEGELRDPIPLEPPAQSIVGQVRDILEEAAPDAARRLKELIDCEDEGVSLRASQAVLDKVIPDKIANPLQFLENYTEDQLIGVIAGARVISRIPSQPSPGRITEKSTRDDRAPQEKRAS